MLAALLSWLLPAAVYGNIYSQPSTSAQYGSQPPIDSQLPVSFNTPSGVQLPTSFSFDPSGQSAPVFHSYNNQPAQYNSQNNYGFYPNQVAAQAFANAAQFAQQFAATTPPSSSQAGQSVVAQIDQQNLAKYSQYLDILQKAYGIQLPGELGQQPASPPYQQSSFPTATSTSYQAGASPYASTYQSGQYPQQVQQPVQQVAQPSYPAATSYQSGQYGGQSPFTGQSSYVPSGQESYQSNYQSSAAQTGYSAASVAPAQPTYQGGSYSQNYQVFPPLPPSNQTPAQSSYAQQAVAPQAPNYSTSASQSPYQPQPAYPGSVYTSQENYYQQTSAPQPAPAPQPTPQQQTQYPYPSQQSYEQGAQPASSFQSGYGQPTNTYGQGQSVQTANTYTNQGQGVQPANTFSNQGANGVSNYQTAALNNVYSSYSVQGQGQNVQPAATSQPRPQVVPYVPGHLPSQPPQQPYVQPPLPSVKPTYSTHVSIDSNSVVEGSVVGEGEDGFDTYFPQPAPTVTLPPSPPPTRPRPTTQRPTLPPPTRPPTTPRTPLPPPTRPPTTKPTTKPELAGTSVQALTQQVRKLPAVLYIDSRSPKAKEMETLLRDTYGLPLVSFYVDKIDRPRLVERNLQQLTAHKGLPYLFICGTFIGSEAHIDNYHRNGQIPQLVEYVCGDEKKKKKKTTSTTKSN